MHCLTSVALFLAGVLLVSPGWAQDKSSTVTCSFDADKEITVEYQQTSFNPKKPVLGHEIPYSKVWAPGGKPLTLFTNTPLGIGGKVLPIGAYTMFVLPTNKQWSLIVSKSTDTSGKYDEPQDLVRVPMDEGELAAPAPQFNATFAHVAPDQCSLRLELEKAGHWAIFQKK